MKNNNKNTNGVYFIKNDQTNLIKIGCSKDIFKRYNTLIGDMKHLGYKDTKLILVDYIECVNYFKLESDLHKLFKSKKVVNEWYKINEKDIEIAKSKINIDKYSKGNECITDNMKPVYIYEDGRLKILYYYDMNKINQSNITVEEKGVWYSLGELCTYPTNTVMIGGNIPSFEDIANYIGMSERNIRRYLKVLEDKNLIKMSQCGYKKSIVVNPEYYATGKDLDLETLKIFNLVECDEEKINNYL